MEDYLNGSMEDDESLDLGRFIRSFVKRWWLILSISAVIVIPWMYYVTHEPPTFEAETWISFENVGGALLGNMIQSRRMKLTSRTFAEEVTAELGLSLELIQDEDESVPLKRQNVFQFFSTSKEPAQGVYRLALFSPDRFTLYHYGEFVDSLSASQVAGDTISFNGLRFSIQPEIFQTHSKVDFRVHEFEETARSLRARERVDFNDTGDLMRISLQGRDPILISETVNALADIFIQKSLELDRDRSRFVSQYLKEQLNLIQYELAKTDQELKTFRDAHLMGLDATTRQTMDRMNGIEGIQNEIRLHIGQLQLLLNKLDPTQPGFGDDVSMPYVYRQIAQLPVFEGDANMTIAKQELLDLDQRRGLMLETYPETNPMVIEVSENIQALEMEISRLAELKMQELNDQFDEMNGMIDSLQQTLNNLPEENLRFIQLDRQRRTNEELYELYMRRYREARITEAVASENITILDPAIPPREPIRANTTKKLLLGVFLGLSLAFGAVIVIEASDKRIKTNDDVRRYLRMPILGAIPLVKFDDYELKDSEKAKSISSQIVTHDYSPTPVGEAYRALRTNLLFSKNIGQIRSLVIGSVSPGEGKSFTAANLAITLAQQKSKTLLVDADLRRGVLHNSFNCPKKPGFTNYLTGVVPFEQVLFETYIPNLSLIPCGSLIPNPSELLGSTKMRRFIEGITKRYDIVIFDTPPLGAATDAVILGTLVDGTAVVIRAGKSNRDIIQKRLEVYQNVQAKVLGAVLNCAGVEIAHDGYSYYRY